jgi:serine/threonine protein kinase
MQMSFICAACGQPTSSSPCQACGADALLAGRYRLETVLGRGEGGVTWRATSADGQVVTIKERPWSAVGSSPRHERAASILQQLDHPSVPAYIEHFVTQQGRSRVLCIVTAFIPGITLSEERTRHRYSQLEVLDIMASLLDALCYLHERSPPVIHRDIKPENVVRQPDGRLALIDFGSVQDELSDPLQSSTTLTGTFGYMAPEQLAGQSSPQSDLYALGALAVNLLSRKPPHTLLDHHQRIDLKTHVSLHPRVAMLLERLLDPDPGRRFPSARATATALRACRSVMIAAPPPAAPAPREPTLENTLRRILREELGEELARRDDVRPEPAVVPATPPAELSLEHRPIELGVPHVSQRRGWWTPTPMTPEQRARPPHPAPIIVVAASVFALVSVLFQLVLT